MQEKIDCHGKESVVRYNCDFLLLSCIHTLNIIENKKWLNINVITNDDHIRKKYSKIGVENIVNLMIAGFSNNY